MTYEEKIDQKIENTRLMLNEQLAALPKIKDICLKYRDIIHGVPSIGQVSHTIWFKKGTCNFCPITTDLNNLGYETELCKSNYSYNDDDPEFYISVSCYKVRS